MSVVIRAGIIIALTNSLNKENAEGRRKDFTKQDRQDRLRRQDRNYYPGRRSRSLFAQLIYYR